MSARLVPSAMAAALLSSVAGCARDPLSGPPELRLGRDECGECGMLISEERCSSGLLVEDRGRREHLVFDDLGCMLDADGGQSEYVVLERFVRDYGSGAWIRAEEASFLLSDPQVLPTPMGSGMVAFAARDDAWRVVQRSGGRVLGYDELADARRAWRARRYGDPPGGD